MNDAAFLAEVLAAPEDDAPRLVYADWLEEQGRAERGELIRVQCELARLDEDDPRRDGLEDRERELLRAHGAEWVDELPDCGSKDLWMAGPAFRRGFVEHLALNAGDIVRFGEELCRRAPLRSVLALECSSVWDEMLALPCLRRFRSLEIIGEHLGS